MNFLTQAYFKPPWTNYFILVFVINCQISSQLLMDIIFGYPLIEQFGTT